MYKLVQKFIRDERGATSIEYGLIAAGIGVALVSLVSSIGGEISNLFDGVFDKLHGFNNPSA